MDLWLEGYEHDPEVGAGLYPTEGAPKVILHTTESGPGSLDRIRDSWRGSANWGKGLPHFIAEGSRYVQLLPLNVGAYTLENHPGGVDTNRAGCPIQVEIVQYAANEFSDEEYNALGRWLGDLVKAGYGIDVTQHPRFLGAGDGIILASYNSPIRLQGSDYTNFNGFMGHQHVPENAHWDPGRLDPKRIENIALDYLGGQTPNDPVEEDEMAEALVWTKPGSKWVEKHIGPEQAKASCAILLHSGRRASYAQYSTEKFWNVPEPFGNQPMDDNFFYGRYEYVKLDD